MTRKDNPQQKSLFSNEENCRRCSTPWCDTNYSIAIAPKKLTKRKANKVRKLIEDKSGRKSIKAKMLMKKANNVAVSKIISQIVIFYELKLMIILISENQMQFLQKFEQSNFI